MRLNDISIDRKLYLAAGVVAVTLVGGGLTGYVSLNNAVSDYERALVSESLSAELARRELDHVRWLERAGEFRADTTIRSLDVELDPTRCDLGRWLGGEARSTAERSVPGLAPALERVQAAHAALHAVGGAVDAALRAGVGGRAEAETRYQADLVPAAEVLLREVAGAGGRVDRYRETTLVGAAASRRVSILILLVGTLIGVAGAIAGGVAFARSIRRPLAQVTELIDELSRGRLGRRLELDRGDELGQLARDMDGLADHLRSNVAGVMDRLARGDTDIEIVARHDEDEIAPSLRTLRDSLRTLVAKVDAVAISGRAGRLDERADAGDLDGDFRFVVEGLNGVLAAVSEPLDEAAAVLGSVASGNLSVRMENEYQGRYADIKTSLNRAVQKLDETLQEVEAAAEQVAAASDQIAGGSETLAQGATEQAGSLEEVSGALQELSSIARRNAEYTDEGRRISDGAREATRQGLDSMTRLSAAMARIKESSDATSRIVKTIDEIAFQTNLLALNASVEAARAGEAGKGFAVVAEEVRGLALRSADAARDTARLIGESVDSSDEGLAAQAAVNARLEELSGSVGRVREVMAEIAAASEQQRGGVDQINGTVEEMNGVTQSTAASAEESASGAEELSSQAQRVREMISGFTLSGSSRDPVAAGRGWTEDAVGVEEDERVLAAAC